MAGNKYVKVDSNGNLAEQAAVDTSAGAGDAGKLVALNPSGQIDSTMLPTSGAITMTASEAISAGSIINVWDSAGTPKVRNADNSAEATRAWGFAPSAISSGASGTVVLGNGMNSSVSGLTGGNKYFLGTGGAVTTTAPTAASSIVQVVGVAKSATELEVLIGGVIIRA